MSWKDNLLPASFRGCAFFYRDTDREGGRKLVNHEFPLRDDNFVEDLGKRSKTHRVDAYVLGDDYMSNRDALEAALDDEGSGTFVHPYKGNLTVSCPSYRVREATQEGRIARFEIVFVEAGTQPSPTSDSSTDTQAFDAGSGQLDTLSGQFGDLYNSSDLFGYIQDALSGNVTALLGDLTSLAVFPGLPAGILDDALALIGASTNDPVTLGGAVTGFFLGYSAAIVDILPVDDPSLSSRGLTPVPDPSYGLAGFAAWGNNLPAIALTTPQRIREAVDQTAFVTLVQGSAVAALAQLYANTQFASAADAEAARSQLMDLVDTQATVAADAGDDVAFAGWMNVTRASATDLTARAQALPLILNYTLASNLPAIALAQRIYQDGSRGGELVARNRAPHPLFMPLEIEAVAA